MRLDEEARAAWLALHPRSQASPRRLPERHLEWPERLGRLAVDLALSLVAGGIVGLLIWMAAQ